jgi:glycosyltransferase involved in cell wall biosynthesis
VTADRQRHALRRDAVLHYVPRWLPVSEQFVHGLVSNVAHRSVVVTPEPFENVDAFAFTPRYSIAWTHRFDGRARRRATTAAIAGAALRHRVGVFHVHFGYRAADVVRAAALVRAPIVLSLHGHDVTTSVSTLAARYRDVFAGVAAVIVPSRFLVDAAIAAGAPRDRVVVIPSGVDTAFFAASPLPTGPPAVAFVGRFTEKKGIDVLLRAWPTVRAAVPDAKLRVLGYGELDGLVHEAAAQDESIDVLAPDARQPRHQARDILRDANLVVTPSRTASDGNVESLLIVNLEAQASGRPLVTTRHGGIPEFVDDGRTAELVPESDPHALAAAIVEILSDPARQQTMANEGPKWAAAFDVRACARAVDELYDRVLAGDAA